MTYTDRFEWVDAMRFQPDPTLTPGDPNEIPDTGGLPDVRTDEVPDEPADTKGD